MTPIDASHALDLLLGATPRVQERWSQHLDYWGQKERGLCNDLGELVALVEERIRNDDAEDLGDLFRVAEDLIAHGDDYVRDVVATCFVESLVNRAPESLPSATLARLFGPRSIEIARSWNRFLGVTDDSL